MKITGLLKALSDQTRIRIFNLLNARELCACELEYILSVSQSSVSQHCGKLKNAGLLLSEKKSQWVYYKINQKLILEYSFIKGLIDDLSENERVFFEDIKKLETLSNMDLCKK